MTTILIVDDDPCILALVRLVVEEGSYLVLEANSAHQAFDRFEEADGQIDLLIADVKLPVFSGIRVALELRALLPNLKIIVTSGYPPALWDEQDKSELDQLPTDSVVTLEKPFVPTELMDTIHGLVGLPCKMVPALQMKASIIGDSLRP